MHVAFDPDAHNLGDKASARLREGMCVVGCILRPKMDADLYPKNEHTNNFNLVVHTTEVYGASCARGSRSLPEALHVVFELDARHLRDKALAITINAAAAASDAATLTIIHQAHRTSNHRLTICKQRALPPLSSATSAHPCT